MATNRRQKIANILSQLNPLDSTVRQQFRDAASKEYSLGRDDWGKAYRLEREKRGLSEEAPRSTMMGGTYPLGIRIRENLGMANPKAVQGRNEMKMGLEQTPAGRLGQLVGAVGADLTQDNSRSIYWLVNAIQATGDVIGEKVISKGLPGLYDRVPVTNPNTGKPVLQRDKNLAIEMGLRDKDSGTLRQGVTLQMQDDGNYKNAQYTKKRVPSGTLAALSIPTGIAVNNAIGLLTPMGGAEGYKAVFEDPDNPGQSSNPIMEVGAKYIAGRRGQLLPYDEFVKVRPDVSREEYNAYKGYRYEKPVLDLDPRDGDIGFGGGAFKAAVDGIHGPEVQILGATAPVTTGIIPYASAIAGTIAGGRMGPGRIGQNAFKGGIAGLAVGTVGGNIIEQERRNRNARANAPVTPALDPEGPYSNM